MKIKLRWIMLFLVTALLGGLAAMPLETGLRILGLKERGIEYAHARGTIWKGEIIGLRFGSNQAGSVALSAKLLASIIGRPSYAFRWQSSFGQGRGILQFRGETQIGVSEGKFLLQSADMPAPIQVSEFAATFEITRCVSASGQLRVVTEDQRPDEGRIECKDDQLSVNIDNLSAAVNAQLNQRIRADTASKP